MPIEHSVDTRFARTQPADFGAKLAGMPSSNDVQFRRLRTRTQGTGTKMRQTSLKQWPIHGETPTPGFGILVIITIMETSSILVVKNAAQLVTSSSGRPRRGKEMAQLTILADAALIIENSIISWVGP